MPDIPAMQGIMHLIRHIALAALILRAFLPAGWMPDAKAGLTICSVQSPKSVHLGNIHHEVSSEHTGNSNPEADKAHHQDCAFAQGAHLITPPLPTAPALPALHAFAAATDQSKAATIAARFRASAPRAPPAFA
jgi:hypothetical protein